jgi:hypothetical protein
MLCPNCQAPIDIDTVFCGHCGMQLPPGHVWEANAAKEIPQIAQGDQWSADMVGDTLSNDRSYEPPVLALSYPLTPTPGHEVAMPSSDQNVLLPPPLSPLQADYPVAARIHHPPSTGRNLISIAMVLALLGVGIAASIFAFWQNKSLTYQATPAKGVSIADARGTVTFSDSAKTYGSINNVDISIHGLHQPPQGSHYEAWIIDEQGARIHSLGTLVKTGTMYAATFIDNNGSILSLGDKVQITVEAAPTSFPAGRVLLSAQLPAGVVAHVDSLLVSYPTTPHQVALLPGLRNQAQLIHTESQALKTTSNKSVIQCHVQNILTILNGQHPAPEAIKAQTCKSLHADQVSTDLGLLGSNNNGYVNNIGVHASLASTQSDATSNIRLYAQQMVIASDNLQQWFTTIDQDAQRLQKNPTSPDTIQELALFSAYALNGVDRNNDGQISPTSGEAGVTQAYLYGQSMATLSLASTSLK